MAAQTPHLPQAPSASVEVFAPARLHLGFLDVSGSLGRQFGSLGLAIDGIGTRIRLMRADHTEAERLPERAARLLAHLSERHAALRPLQLTVLEAIPEHIGLGSGTQLGLAIAAGVAALAGERISARALAELVDRGARSGIGIGAFELGGLLLDGGKGAESGPAPIVARAAFPEAWRILLIFDHERRGLFGDAEKAAFRALPAFPAEAAAHLCHLVLMRLLPGLSECAFDVVADAIGEISARVGDYFAPVQGGRFASPRMSRVLSWLRDQGIAGIGQSSWGPTGFALMPSEAEARRLEDALRSQFGGDGRISFQVCAGRNRGAEIRRSPNVIESHAFARSAARRDTRSARR